MTTVNATSRLAAYRKNRPRASRSSMERELLAIIKLFAQEQANVRAIENARADRLKQDYYTARSLLGEALAVYNGEIEFDSSWAQRAREFTK